MKRASRAALSTVSLGVFLGVFLGISLGVALLAAPAAGEPPPPAAAAPTELALPDDRTPTERQADELVLQGAALADQGRFEQAILRFKAAEGQLHRAIHLCNIGLGYVRLERWPQGLYFLDRCVAESVEPLPEWVAPMRDQLLQTLRAANYAPVRLEATPGGAHLKLSTFSASSFGPDELEGAPTEVWLPFGEHQIEATLHGHLPARRRLTIDAGIPRQVALTLQPLQAPPQSPSGGARAPGWLFLGAGIAATLAGITFGALAADAGHRDTAAGVAYGFAGAGAASLGAGLWLILSSEIGARDQH